MLTSVIYHPVDQEHTEESTFDAHKSPILQILFAKAVVVVLIFLLSGLMEQELAATIIAISGSLEFWVTKNLGRKYLQATWSVDTSGEEDIWIYQANFKTPSSMQQLFWYSQLIYGISLLITMIIIATKNKYSIVCAIIIAFAANYVNFYAFGKIITLRNAGVLEKIADEAKIEGEMRETIRLPMMHNRLSKLKDSNVDSIRRSLLRDFN